jgi:hypothetical protein
MKKNFAKNILFISVIFSLFSCDPTTNKNPAFRKIKQSFKIHEDNVNIKDLRINAAPLKEAASFFYNPDGLLDSLVVMSDTTSSATILKSIKLFYQSDLVRAKLFSASSGASTANIYYNTNKQVTKIIFEPLVLNLGFILSYSNNKLSRLQSSPDLKDIYKNFVYDGNNNLIQFISVNNDILTKVNFTYHTQNIPQDFDIKLASFGFQYLYAGGVNILSLLGLNTGIANTNRIFTRTETDFNTGNKTIDYIFNYSENSNNEIIGRNITVNDTIDVEYDYRY